MSISTHYPYVREAFPSRMIMPLQDALTCSLPSTSGLIKTHNPFPGSLVEIRGELHFYLQRIDPELISRNRGSSRYHAFITATQEAGIPRE